MKKVMFTLVALTLSMSMAYACGFNTGYIEWSQPNGVGFTACYWSDGFQTWMETDDGYRIFKGYDGWFYYAVLNSRGEFSPSDKKVGIDPPLASSYKLERSAERIAEIQAYKEAWNRGAEEGYQENLASSLDDPVTYKLGVVLVDFTPSARRTENENYPYGYTKALFDSMFFSRNHWIGDEFSTPPTPHPELEALFGSFADYYWEQSLETVQFEGRDGMRSIVNPDTLVNGYLIPRWVILDSSATYYDELGGGWPFGAYTLLHDMISAANAQLADVLGDSPLDSVFDKVGFITAGYTSLSGGNLRGGWTEYVGGKYYVCAEVYGWEGNPNYPAGFRHIGTHVHEFAHTIGLAHYNFYYPALYCRYFNLMGYGGNGPDYREACPSGFCPYARVEKLNYVEYDTIQTDTTLIISYNYDNPKYYLIKVPSSSQRFVLENRLREGFDLWTPNDANFVSPDPQNIDPNGNQGGLLIWRNRSHIDLLAADDVPYHERMVPDSDEDMLNLARDLFPYNQQDGAGSGLNFNDFTSPSSKISDEVFSHIAIQNITWDDVNKTTTVDIYFNAWKGNITENTTWDGDIYVYGNIFVNPGVTLTILPNTTIKFDGYYRLNVQGKLIAEGTLTNPITFCKIPSTQNWFGIMFEDSSNDSSVVKYCNIKDAYRGVSCIYASPTISNNTISNVTYGIYVSYSSATLSNNIINQNNSYGIYLYKSSSTTTNN
ncbi:right-handed parallel beta-helix repeat-containing protein [candidate division KSB1 bacterium]|nr:right-handed parallel beta-helix repeat-containing protein [candidate division KSB1 bacterium]